MLAILITLNILQLLKLDSRNVFFRNVTAMLSWGSLCPLFRVWPALANCNESLKHDIMKF
jgi:hypothetical protein